MTMEPRRSTETSGDILKVLVCEQLC